MRKLHRWIAITAAAFLVFVAVTGSLLALDEVALRLSGKLPKAYGGPADDAPKALATLRQQDVAGWLDNVYRSARKVAPDAKFTSVWLRVRGDLIQGIVTIGGPGATQLTFNAVTGERLFPDSPSLPATGYLTRWDYHQMIKRIHRGDYFGMTGRWMDVASGVALAVLGYTALQMYLQLWLTRRKIGRRSLFW